MLNLGTQRTEADRLSWHLKWGRFVVPSKGVVRQKDGSFFRTIEIRGRDLDSTTDEEFLQSVNVLNNVLGAFGRGYCLHFEYRNGEAVPYPRAEVGNPVARLVDDERRGMLGAPGMLSEQWYYLTVTYQPPPDAVQRLERTFMRPRVDRAMVETWEEAVEPFVRSTDVFFNVLANHMALARPLDDDALVTYLGWCLDVERVELRMPKYKGFPITNVAAGKPFVPGSFPSFVGYDDGEGKRHDIAEWHVRVIGVKGYPEVSYPDILSGMSSETTKDGRIIPFRFVQRFVCMNPDEMEEEMRGRWSERRDNQYTFKDYFHSFVTKKPLGDADPAAVAAQITARASLEAAAQEGGEATSAGWLTPLVVVWDRNLARVDEKVNKVREFLGGRGMKTQVETGNATTAWLSSLPGEHRVNVRSDPLPSIHLVHCLPVSAVWSGPVRNEYLTEKRGRPVRPLLYLTTAGRTPHRLDLHNGQNANTIVVAPVRTGKSTLLASAAVAAHHDDDAQVYSLDVDALQSAIMPACLSCGGEVMSFGDGGAAMQPLSDLETQEGRDYAYSCLVLCATVQGVAEELGPTRVSQAAKAVLSVLAEEPAHRRTMKRAARLGMHDELTAAWGEYGEDGPWGRFLGGHRDVLGEARWVTFELSNVVGKGPTAAPAMDCLFHKLLQRCEVGRQTMIQGDEAWLLLREYPKRLEEYLRRLPKKDGYLMLAIHNLLDAGPIAAMLRDTCKTKIFGANPMAATPEGLRVLEDWNMNRQQGLLIAGATPKRDLYVVREDGARLAHLDLGPVAKVICGSGGSDSAALVRRLLAEGRDNFAARLLRARAGMDPTNAHALLHAADQLDGGWDAIQAAE